MPRVRMSRISFPWLPAIKPDRVYLRDGVLRAPDVILPLVLELTKNCRDGRWEPMPRLPAWMLHGRLGRVRNQYGTLCGIMLWNGEKLGIATIVGGKKVKYRISGKGTRLYTLPPEAGVEMARAAGVEVVNGYGE